MTAFHIKPGLSAIPISEYVSFSDERPLLEMLESFEISHGSNQPLNSLTSLTLSTHYSISMQKQPSVLICHLSLVLALVIQKNFNTRTKVESLIQLHEIMLNNLVKPIIPTVHE